MDAITKQPAYFMKETRSSFNKLKRYKKVKVALNAFIEVRNSNYEKTLRTLLENNKNHPLSIQKTGMTVEEFVQKERNLFNINNLVEKPQIINDFITEYFVHPSISEQLSVMTNEQLAFNSAITKLQIQTKNQVDSEKDNSIKTNIIRKYRESLDELKTQYDISFHKNTYTLIEIALKEFKNDQNILNTNSTIKTKKNDLQRTIDETMLKVTQTAGISDLLYAMPAITKYGHIDPYDTSTQTYTDKDNDIKFTFSIPEAFKKNPTLTENHVKLFLFALHKHCTGDKKRTLIPYKEFFEFKGLEDSKDNRKKLKKEIEELESVEFDYKYKEKGAKEWTKVSEARVISYLDTRPGSGISVTFGTWADCMPNTFVDINKAVFKYPVTRNSIGATTISFKLRELNSMNKKSVRVRILTDLLDISETVINKHGFSWVKDKLERELERIEEAEKLNWQYRNGIHDSRIDFENDYIEFKYPNS
ncbi:hypothetical protein VSK70_26470 [Bacillus sp. WOD8 KX774193]|nr:hypothetical protein [Bacillus sp. WOD8 KX774193]MEC3859446.1 hypothetical protein [Bacillus sp. WOD8 KX774193]